MASVVHLPEQLVVEERLGCWPGDAAEATWALVQAWNLHSKKGKVEKPGHSVPGSPTFRIELYITVHHKVLAAHAQNSYIQLATLT